MRSCSASIVVRLSWLLGPSVGPTGRLCYGCRVDLASGLSRSRFMPFAKLCPPMTARVTVTSPVVMTTVWRDGETRHKILQSALCIQCCSIERICLLKCKRGTTKSDKIIFEKFSLYIVCNLPVVSNVISHFTCFCSFMRQ